MVYRHNKNKNLSVVFGTAQKITAKDKVVYATKSVCLVE
jgi:hypothetical protein